MMSLKACVCCLVLFCVVGSLTASRPLATEADGHGRSLACTPGSQTPFYGVLAIEATNGKVMKTNKNQFKCLGKDEVQKCNHNTHIEMCCSNYCGAPKDCAVRTKSESTCVKKATPYMYCCPKPMFAGANFE